MFSVQGQLFVPTIPSKTQLASGQTPKAATWATCRGVVAGFRVRPFKYH
jgi:hypothetical protein